MHEACDAVTMQYKLSTQTPLENSMFHSHTIGMNIYRQLMKKVYYHLQMSIVLVCEPGGKMTDYQ